MAAQNAKYDVGISFLAPRESIAIELSELLAGHATTFVYSERQAELAGRDGVEAFARVFALEAKLAVVLYEHGWGHTPWTRIEETAIKERVLAEGADFLVLANLDGSQPPAWVPKTRIYLNYQRFGMAGLAAVVQQRLVEIGSPPQVEDAIQMAARLAEAGKREALRQAYLLGQDGCNAAESEIGLLFDEIQRIHGTVTGSVSMILDRDGCRTVWLYREHHTLSLHWHRMYSNTLDDSSLALIVHRGRVGPGMYANLSKPQRLTHEDYRFDVDDALLPRWIELGGQRRMFSTRGLADEIMRRALQFTDERR